MQRNVGQQPKTIRAGSRQTMAGWLSALSLVLFAGTSFAQDAAPGESFVPTIFELTRLSDNGSLVVVGNAEPGALVELIDGTIPIAQAEANAHGEWVLSPTQTGDDYDGPLGIRTTTADGRFQYVSTQMIVFGEDGAVMVAATPQERASVLPSNPAPDQALLRPIDPQVAASGDVAAEGEARVDGSFSVPTANLTLAIETDGGAAIHIDGEIDAPLAITVRRGDTLWEIAERYLGSGARYPAIVAANPDTIRNPGRLWPGDVVILPVRPR